MVGGADGEGIIDDGLGAGVVGSTVETAAADVVAATLVDPPVPIGTFWRGKKAPSASDADADRSTAKRTRRACGGRLGKCIMTVDRCGESEGVGGRRSTSNKQGVEAVKG